MAFSENPKDPITLEDDPVQDNNDKTYNEITSFPVENMKNSEIIFKLSSILSSYSCEIDFKVNTDKNEITDGIVFISNYYCVFFDISIIKETDDPEKLRVEFRRQSGDDLAAAKFLGDIKSLFFDENKTHNIDENKEEKQETKQENTLINLELNANDLQLQELKVDQKDKEMMMVHEALINDQFLGDNINENAEDYLYNKLLEKKVINAKEITDHKILCSKIMNKSVLLHDDIAIVRASLIILKRFADVYTDLFLNENDCVLFELVNELLKTQKYALMKKYAIDLLYELATIKEEKYKQWKLENKLKTELATLVKQFEMQSQNSKYYQADMFKSIYEKL